MATSPNNIINLTAMSVALVESNSQGMDILAQIFVGFGVRSAHRCANAAEARELLEKTDIDLMVTEVDLPDTDGYELVRWLRSSKLQPNSSAPVVLISGHTPMRNVLLARDCGANSVIVKPLTPQVLLDRIIWLAADKRDFIQSPGYTGPDRRWRNIGPPANSKGRRHTDLSTQVGEATDPNLDQTDIDAMFRPTKVVI